MSLRTSAVLEITASLRASIAAHDRD